MLWGMIEEMKKFLKVLFIITIIIISIIIISNLLNTFMILFFGRTVGNSNYPDSIWWGEKYLSGISGLKTYYSVLGETILIFEVPIIIVCLIYQVIYLKIIKKCIKLHKIKVSAHSNL